MTTSTTNQDLAITYTRSWDRRATVLHTVRRTIHRYGEALERLRPTSMTTRNSALSGSVIGFAPIARFRRPQAKPDRRDREATAWLATLAMANAWYWKRAT